MRTTPPGPPAVRQLRAVRDFAPIDLDLFTSTTDPMVIAFHTSVLLHQGRPEALTLQSLQQRWGTSKVRASAARRALIDLGYWAEVRKRVSGGQLANETVMGEARFTRESLRELAAQYPPSSLIECGGKSFTVSTGGGLVDVVRGGA